MHGPTFMANPLACAVRLANLDLLVDCACGRAGRADRTWACSWAGGRAGHRRCTRRPDARCDRGDSARAAGRCCGCYTAAVEQSVWLRPFRDLIYTMPPYICTNDDVAQIASAMMAAAKAGSAGG